MSSQKGWHGEPERHREAQLRAMERRDQTYRRNASKAMKDAAGELKDTPPNPLRILWELGVASGYLLLSLAAVVWYLLVALAGIVTVSLKWIGDKLAQAWGRLR
ncbi:hypothetical protein [Halorubrum sp. CSM-61]|uniref:hypothetical protein n=1 Tax=Halorubrum sp. CSM-61 TaxID=2485838 RepID=UPI000F4C647E|nr:hypothetical protein [Halorubrum sp. CSM-61]